jgi:tetratricopeptide (TPR) repeat protein
VKLLSRLLTASLTVGLALYALISFPLVLLTNVAAGTLLLAVAALLLRRRLTKSPTSSIGATESFLLMFGVVVTTQTLIACDFYGTQRPLDSTLGYAVVVCLVHCATMFGLVFSGKTQLAGIGLAVVYTSFLYLPSFATPEVVPSFGFLALLGLVLSLTPIDSQRRVASGSRWPVPILLFVFVALVASSVSLAPHESLSWLFRLLVLVGFTWTIPRVIQRTDEWRNLALLVAVMGVALPAVLGGAKLLQLSGSLGLWPAVQYRLGLNELGRANLVARTLMVGAPLVFAFARASARRRERFLWWALALLMVFTFVASRSWGAWVGVAITLFVGIALLAEQRWAYWGRRPKASRHLALSLLAVASVVAVVGLVRLAPQANVGSFNGRLFQFRSTLLSLFDRPALGFGPGHYHWKSQYASDVGWLVDTQGSLDNPLQSVRWLRGSTPLHTHNLFLEIAAGTGFLGMCAFAWFVAGIIAAGLDLRRRSDGENRVLIAGSLLGIVASVGWGLLDVMEISPPFFSFPTWALVGLLLAAPQALGLPKRLGRSSRLATKLGPPSALASVLRSVVTVSAVGGALVVVVALLAGNFHYRLAYTAYQERRWLTAAEEFDQAARWEPLNAKYHQMRGEALINLGRYSEAIPAYEQAVRLKREFAPYHAQLGWLYWLQGDLEEATRHLQKAVEMDPREAWREGLHADLGLAYVAQGRLEEALPLFQETIELEPQMALAPYWIPVQGKDGGLEIVLDPVYMAGSKENLGHGEISGPLQARILAHLGRADYTPRLFGYDTTVESALSFTQVLGAIDADYRAALALGSREALPLLATVAEATQLVGLHDDAERAFLEFQTVFPESAYGFRGLGELYREQPARHCLVGWAGRTLPGSRTVAGSGASLGHCLSAGAAGQSSL